ncbi:purple acid phosphatase 27 [Perilla frutescens var. frutescens]|nr:purple acid phosphatase 27 [Perilla frutescens var. frutescens]
MKMKLLFIFLLSNLSWSVTFGSSVLKLHSDDKGRELAGEQPLSKIAIHKTVLALRCTVSIKATPLVLGVKGEDTEWVDVRLQNPLPSEDDWVGVFSPAKFNESVCEPDPNGGGEVETPYICTSPIKYKYANFSNPNYTKSGKTTFKFQLINQRADFSFALFTGGLSNPKLVAVSNYISFANPKAPLYPRLAQGKSWDIMTVTWTSGYNINEAVPFVEWGWKGQPQIRSPAGTLTFSRGSMCGEPARTVGWRDPGFFHTSFLKDLWPNTVYTYRMGHLLNNGSYIWSKRYSFRSSPYPGQDSLQRIIIFGDMGKAERDGSNEYADYQPGSLNTTDRLIEDLDNYDIVFHIGDLPYANGYISQWDQFTAQVEPIASVVPYMIASGNHERDWPDSGSFYNTPDSGGECGVLAETMYYVPAENRAKFWYSTDYGMFHFCVADSEHDWREGSEQYKFIEKCLASADRQKQPWLIFIAHRVLGYSSNDWYGLQGSFEEPMGRESLQKLWQKYKVDIAFYGHVHNYERVCPIYQNQCVNSAKSHYSGTVNGTIHVVVGGGGSHLSEFTTIDTVWSIYKDLDYGFTKLTAFNHSSLLFEYKKSSDGEVYDSFTISRDYRDVLACVHDGCECSRNRILSEISASPSPAPAVPEASQIFSVVSYGAVGDGVADDTQAFKTAWDAACQADSTAAAAVVVLLIEGSIMAPEGPESWAKNNSKRQWLVFYRINGMSMQGGGLIDGRGQQWWDLPCKPHRGVNGTTLPGPCDSPVNSPQFHIRFDSCTNVHIDSLSIKSAAASPNTDGIHLENSNDVQIYNSIIANGDDCVSIGAGTFNVDIRNITCGPSHGISIGSLGPRNTRACVSNITVRDSVIKHSDNGVRIKTWQGGYGAVSKVSYSNIVMDTVRNPIMIDQYYCTGKACSNQTSAVYISDVSYAGIKGTYDVRSPPMHFACSDAVACTNLTIYDVELLPAQGHKILDPFCWNAYGDVPTLTIPPLFCFNHGFPTHSLPANDVDQCTSLS